MSINATTLVGNISATDTQITLASGTGVAVGKFIQIDDETMLIQSIDQSPVLKVARGQNGSAAVTHSTGTFAYVGLGSDFPPIPAPRTYTYGAAGALTVAPGTHILNTGAASAFTLRDPTGAEEGLEMLIMAATAHAYTVTNTTGFNGGGSGADVATYGGAVGDNFRIKAVNRKWNVEYVRNVTLG